MYLNKFVNYVHSQENTEQLELEIKVLADSRIRRPGFITSNASLDDIKFIAHQVSNQGEASISQTINFIETKANFMTVKQLHYVNGVQDPSKKSFYTKQSLMPPIYLTSSDKPAFKIGLNREIPQQDAPDIFDIVRFRFRYSVDIPNWRMDLTLVKELRDTTNISQLKNIRDKLFNKLTPKTFLDNINWNYSDRIELEFEYTGDLSKFSLAHITQLDQFIQPSNKTYHDCICDIARIIRPESMREFQRGTYGLKQLGASPIELTRKSYFTDVMPTIDNFIITEKIDGIRTMLIIQDNMVYILTSNSREFKSFELDESNSCKLDEIKLKNNINQIPIILDTECIEIDGHPRYYIFDIISHPDCPNISKQSYYKRLECFNGIETQNYTINGKEFLYNKNFLQLDKENYGTVISDFYESMKTQEYDIDGLIFISSDANKTIPYQKTRNYKWKPIELMAIDFIAKKCPAEMLGISPYVSRENQTLYLLFCGMRREHYKKLGVEKFRAYTKLFSNVCDNQYGRIRDSYYPIQFSPSSNPYAYLFWSDNNKLDGKVVELSYDTTLCDWHLHRIREDRAEDVKRKSYYGNYFKYAEYIWMNYQNPLTITGLGEGSNNSYFSNTDTSLYFAQRKFNNYVKKKLIELNAKQTDLSWFIDLCSGNGQDLTKYIDCGFRHGLLTDIDRDALTEAINRKFMYIENKNIDRDKYCKLFVQHMDMTRPNKENAKLIYNGHFGIPPEGVPLVVCNFALHYFIPNLTKMRNFINLLNKILAPGGIFIFTAFSGERVFDLLQEDEWRATENNVKKYSIKKKYTGDEFTGINQKIDVLLPFSDGYYTENLINIDLLNTELEKKKIRLMAEASFDTYMNQFAEDKPHFYEKLSEDDKKYVSLYNFYVYHKDNKAKR